MAAVFLSPIGNGWQFFDDNGLPLNGGFVNTYAAGTTTPIATFTTAGGTVQNANPIPLTAAGRIATQVWLSPATAYKFVPVSSVSAAVGTAQDNIYGINDPTTINGIGYTGATISGALIMNLAPINEAQGANIPVAAQINLTTATGNYLQLTGSGTITSLQLVQGAYRELEVSTVSSAFQNSAKLIMLGGTSITPAAGDILGFRGEGISGVVRNVMYSSAANPIGMTGGVISVCRNLQVHNNPGTPNTKIDVAADEIEVENANGNTFVSKSVSLTIDFGTTGANGIDTGIQASNTWYYIWSIAKPDGTVAGIGSLSATAPTLPSGYTFKALVSAARSDNSTHFLLYKQAGFQIQYVAQQNVVNGSTATVETAVNVSSQVPPIAASYTVDWTTYFSNAASSEWTAEFRLVTGTTARKFIGAVSSGAFATISTTMEFINVAQNFYFTMTVTSGSSPAYVSNGNIAGFRLPGGGQ